MLYYSPSCVLCYVLSYILAWQWVQSIYKNENSIFLFASMSGKGKSIVGTLWYALLHTTALLCFTHLVVPPYTIEYVYTLCVVKWNTMYMKVLCAPFISHSAPSTVCTHSLYSQIMEKRKKNKSVFHSIMPQPKKSFSAITSGTTYAPTDFHSHNQMFATSCIFSLLCCSTSM